MLAELEELLKEASRAVSDASNSGELNEIEIRFLGRSGKLTQMLKSIGKLPSEERPAFGKRAN